MNAARIEVGLAIEWDPFDAGLIELWDDPRPR
jgi:hypothetical protein